MITVTMPYYGVGPLVRRAVDSILRQSYRDWQLVIVNDGDPDDPWKYLADIRDSRIVRFDMDRNRGRYFADAVIFEACEPEWWALQDPDDVSFPARFASAVRIAQKTGVCAGPWRIHRPDGRSFVSGKAIGAPVVREEVRYIGGYGPGLVSGDRLRQVGGFHPGYRVGYDTLMLNLVRMCGPFGTTRKVLGAKYLRAGSLTMSPKTGMKSAYRKRVHGQRLTLWHKAWDSFHASGEVASVIRSDIPAQLKRDVAAQAARLRKLL